MTQLSDIQDLLSDAMQADLEHGVRWLNEEAARAFNNGYPALVAAIDEIMEMSDEDE